MASGHLSLLSHLPEALFSPAAIGEGMWEMRNETHQLSPRLSAHGLLIFFIYSPRYSVDSTIAEFQYTHPCPVLIRRLSGCRGTEGHSKKSSCTWPPSSRGCQTLGIGAILKNQMTWKDKPENSQTHPPTPTSPFHTHLGI